MFRPSDVNLNRVKQQIETLAELGRLESGGVRRHTFSEAHIQACQQVALWMSEAGLDAYFDPWGNLFGRTPNVLSTNKGVLTGSHLDSVPNGGNYDGPLGVLSSLEAVRMIVERGLTLERPLEVVSFIEEEGARWYGLLGSVLAVGLLSEAEIGGLVDREGNRYLDVLSQIDFGYPIDTDSDLVKRTSHYIELHIEQGKRLERTGTSIGVVTGIAGPNRLMVRIIGRSDHAGATAYEDRYDTLLATAEIIQQVREIGMTQFKDRGHMTVGRIVPHPNVINVVAGETDVSVDFRADTNETAESMRSAIESMIANICDKHGLTYEILAEESVPPAPTPENILQAITHGAEQADVESMPLISWAAHDAMVMAGITQSGMIFVPCRDGRSHCWQEFVEDDDIADGIATLANTLVELAVSK